MSDRRRCGGTAIIAPALHLQGFRHLEESCRRPTPLGTLATQLPDTPPGVRITLMGHVHRRRELATVSFLILRDRTGLAQIVFRPEQLPTAGLPGEETVVRIEGTATANAHAPGASR